MIHRSIVIKRFQKHRSSITNLLVKVHLDSLVPEFDQVCDRMAESFSSLPEIINRKEFGPRKISPVQLSQIDWSRRDIDIAEDLGVTRERIRQIRQILGLPPSIHSKADTLRLLECLEQDLQGKTKEELKLLFPDLTWTTIFKYLRKRNIFYRKIPRINPNKGKGFCGQANPNFDLPNSVLEDIWNKPNAFGVLRQRNKAGKSKWAGTGTHGSNPEFLKAVAAEQQKAATFYQRGIVLNPEIQAYQAIPRLKKIIKRRNPNSLISVVRKAVAEFPDKEFTFREIYKVVQDQFPDQNAYLSTSKYLSLLRTEGIIKLKQVLHKEKSCNKYIRV